jgi:hypothetical protein
MEPHDRDITNVSSKGTGFLEQMNQSNEDSHTYVSVGRRFLRLRLHLSMDHRKPPDCLIVAIPQLAIHSRLGNHLPQCFGHVALIPIRAIDPPEDVFGKL